MSEWVVKLVELQGEINYEFEKLELLKRALTTMPYKIENGLLETEHQESLRNLGDALIDVIIYEHVIRSGVTRKGEADNFRQTLGGKKLLKLAALKFGLEKYIRWGDGEIEQKVWKTGKKVISECLEALIGAVYLDSNIESARNVYWCFLTNNM